MPTEPTTDRARRRAKAPKGLAYAVKREQLAALVASGVPVKRAAREVGVAAGTAFRWVVEPEVAARIDDLMRSSVERARRRMLSAADRAVEAALEAMANGDWRAGMAILDRIGLHPRQTVEHVQEDLTQATVAELAERAEKLRARIAEMRAFSERPVSP